MISIIALLPIVLVGFFQTTAALATPTELSERALVPCTVFVQRWYDNTFDIDVYATSPLRDIMNTESWAMSPGNSIPTAAGSHNLITTDVANPAVVGGSTNWNDPGKVSFTWGSQSWDSYSAGSPCTVVPVGYAGAAVGGATTYTCTFSCDG